MRRKSESLAQSVQTRLVRHARDTNVDPNLVMARFASERFLYRRGLRSGRARCRACIDAVYTGC